MAVGLCLKESFFKDGGRDRIVVLRGRGSRGRNTKIIPLHPLRWDLRRSGGDKSNPQGGVRREFRSQGLQEESWGAKTAGQGALHISVPAWVAGTALPPSRAWAVPVPLPRLPGSFPFPSGPWPRLTGPAPSFLFSSTPLRGVASRRVSSLLLLPPPPPATGPTPGDEEGGGPGARPPPPA